nr:MAG TPA: hypothetical protein [Caudoviricetes sp.]DAP00572.1 MAG TPA: hypothetical protein [Caudoviricetes sp.]
MAKGNALGKVKEFKINNGQSAAETPTGRRVQRLLGLRPLQPSGTYYFERVSKSFKWK